MKLAKIQTKRLAGKKSKAQSLIEYALILAMVTVIAITALQLLGRNMAGTLQKSAQTVDQGGQQVQQNACESFGGTWNTEDQTCDMSSATPSEETSSDDGTGG